MTRLFAAIVLSACAAQPVPHQRAIATPRHAVLVEAVQPHLRAFYARQLCEMVLPYSELMVMADPRGAAQELCQLPEVWTPFERLYTDELAAELRAAKLKAIEAWKQRCAQRALEGQSK